MAEVTILLAAYRGGTYIAGQIDSILAQTFSDWELVISDDGEQTGEVLDRYEKEHPDRIRRLHAGRRFGSAQKHFLWMTGQCAGSEYLMYCDQDDRWHPDKIEKTRNKMKELEAHAGSDKPLLVHTDLCVVDADMELLSPSFWKYSRLDGSRLALNELAVQNVVTGCTVMINRALAQKALAGAQEPAMLMHDWWFALTAAAFGEAACLPEATMDYRQHGGNTVGAKNAGSLKYILEKLRGGSMRQALIDTAAQAGAFADCYEAELSPEQLAMLRDFAACPGASRRERRAVYSRYGLWKNDLRRRIGQRLWW